MVIFLYFATFFFLLITVLLLSSFYFSYFRLLRGEAPFVPLPRRAISEVLKALEINQNSVVYDLGCGDGRVLLAAHEAQPLAKYVGYEKNFVIFLLARLKVFKIRKPHSIKILKNDFFLENLSPATHIFTYLLPKPMRGLDLKLKGELRPGTRLVSCDFPLKSKNPTQVIDIKSSRFAVAGSLYVYDF